MVQNNPHGKPSLFFFSSKKEILKNQKLNLATERYLWLIISGLAQINKIFRIMTGISSWKHYHIISKTNFFEANVWYHIDGQNHYRLTLIQVVVCHVCNLFCTANFYVYLVMFQFTYCGCSNECNYDYDYTWCTKYMKLHSFPGV